MDQRIKLLSEIIFTFLFEKTISDSLPDFKIQKIFELIRSRYIINRKAQNPDHEFQYKLHLLHSIARFYESPKFDFNSIDQEKECQNRFYKTLITLLSDYPIQDQNYLNYIASNHGCFNLKSNDELIGSIKYELNNNKENMYPYMLGFRSIYSILRTNINDISIDYIQFINNELKGFKKSFFQRELLIQ